MSGRVWTVFLFAVVAVLSAWGATRLEVQFGLDKVLNPNPVEFEKAVELYDKLPWQHTDAYVVLSFDRQIQAADLEVVGILTKRLAAGERVASVTSLHNISVVERGGFWPKPFAKTVGVRSVFEVAWEHPLLRGTLMSKDGRSTLLVVAATRDEDDQFDGPALIDWLEHETKAILEEASSARGSGVRSASVGNGPGAAKATSKAAGQSDATGEGKATGKSNASGESNGARAPPGQGTQVRVIGSVVVLRALHDKLSGGIARILTLELLIFLVLLPLWFRTVRGSVLPLGVVLVALLVNFGWMGWLGYPLTIIDVAIPGLVVIIGLCDAIHLLQRFEEAYSETRDRRESIRQMMHSVGRACFYTSFTTGVGFLSLLVTEHDTVSTFGVKAAVSVVVTFGVVVLLIPILLAMLPIGRPRPLERARERWLGYGRAKLTIALTCIGVVFAIIGSTRVVADSHLLEELRPSDPVVQDLTWFDENFSGIIDAEVVVRGDLEDPTNFAALERFESEMGQEDGVTRVESLTLFAREALGNPAKDLDENLLRAAFAKLRLAQAFLPTHLFDKDFELARVVFKTRDIGSVRMTELRDRMVELARELPPGLTIEPTGYVMMATASSQLVVDAITQSLMLSLIVIAVFVAFIFRSWALALVALATNLLPLLFAFGLSGWLGIELTIGSALIYCLGLGLAVDDTIHILTRYLHEKRELPQLTTQQHLTHAVQSSGKALISTSVVLGVGTLCHLSAEFNSLINVGVLLSSVIATALVVDLWFLPILVEKLEGRREPDPAAEAS